MIYLKEYKKDEFLESNYKNVLCLLFNSCKIGWQLCERKFCIK
jgi:hypothetical protein